MALNAAITNAANTSGNAVARSAVGRRAGRLTDVVTTGSARADIPNETTTVVMPAWRRSSGGK